MAMTDFGGAAFRPVEGGRTRRSVLAIFGASMALHLAIAWKAHEQAPAPAAVHKRSRAEIEFVRRPPPPTPMIIPPQAAQPQIPKALQAPRPVSAPRISAPPPVQAAPAAEPADPPAPSPDPAPADGVPGGTGTADPTPVVAAPPPPPPPAPIVEAHEAAYLKNPRPAYPSIAQREGWEGTVLLRVRVSPNGRAAGVTVQRSSGRTALDNAAVAAVSGWTFVPATQGGSPIAGWVNVPVDFRLQ